jgi:hypothetical protein
MPDFARIVGDAYQEILERAPDPGGLANFNQRMNQGLSEAELREALLRSDEYAQKNPPPGSMALRVEGNRFMDPRGNEVRPLGAIVCCQDAKANGWPLVSLEALDLFAGHRLSYTHCRLGPFTVAGEDDPIYVGYLTAADGRVDLEQFFPAFWARARGIADRARQLRIYVEFDLIDRWVRQHGETDMPQVDPWSARNNIQGIEAGGLAIFRSAPAPIHERWVRKAVAELGEFENVLFQVGNEGFKSFSEAWEIGVYGLVKDELRRHGFSDRLVATNTQDPTLESRLDYVTRHATEAQRAGAKPILVNEYDSLPPSEVIRQVRRARRFGTHFMYWRGDHSQSQWEGTLAQLEGIAASSLATAPPEQTAARASVGRRGRPRRTRRRLGTRASG